MSLQNIFTMIKSDRYTADGREELNEAHKADVEDRVYKIGEISEKTGLQKTANGWVKPKQGGNVPAKKEVSGVKVNKKAMDYAKKEGRTDILPSGISTDDFSDKQLKEYADGLKESLSTQTNFTEETRKGTEQELKAVEAELAKRSGGESKPAEPPKAPKPSVQEYMKARDTVKKYDETYKKQLEEYENGQRLRANGGGAVLDPLYGLKPNDLSKNEEYMKAKDIISRMESKDSAPRVLTGDCKIRVRK